MPLEKIYIARHGVRHDWDTTTWESPTGSLRDSPLSAYGEVEAKELAKYFLGLPEEEKPTAIFSSPYCNQVLLQKFLAKENMIDRCLQTAQPTAQALGLPLFVEHGISAWYGRAAPGTGLHPRPGSTASLKSFFQEIDPEWSSIWYPPQKGEDVPELYDRTDGFLELFVPAIERTYAGKHKNILLVSHVAPIIALIGSLVGDRKFPARLGCCSLTELVPIVQNSNGKQRVCGAWEVKTLANESYLTKGASNHWGFEDMEIIEGKVVEDPGEPGLEADIEGPSGPQVANSML